MPDTKRTKKMVAMGVFKQVDVGEMKGLSIREMWNHTMEVLEQVTYMDECT